MTCHTTKQELALAAAKALAPHQLDQIRDHCGQCQACAKLFDEFSQVVAGQEQVAAELPSLVRPDRRSPALRSLHRSAHRSLPWRWLAPLAAATALVLALVSLQPPAPPSEKPAWPAPAPRAPASDHLSPPNFAVYRQAWMRFGDESLEALLATHERHLLPSEPSVALASLSDAP